VSDEQERWSAVDDYLTERFVAPDPVLDAALRASAEAGLPPNQVSPLQGKLLWLLARVQGARRILEIGTLGGYSAIWMARALPADGRLVTLEADPQHAAVARANLERAGLAERVEVLEGPALDALAKLEAEGADPFDLVFLDADKEHNAEYLDAAVRLSRPGTLIVADNVIRGGAVADPDRADASARGIRRMNDRVTADPRLEGTTLQTVGRKTWDGMALVRVG
jgi:predicted O-methyltransferase YrrM